MLRSAKTLAVLGGSVRSAGLSLAVAWLLAACASTPPPPAVEAIQRNDLPALKAQLDAGVPPRTTTHGGMYSLMYYALIDKRWDMADLLRQRGVSLYDDGAVRLAAFEYPAFKWDDSTIKALLARGFDLKRPLKNSNRTPLEFSCSDTERIRLFLKYGAPVNQAESTTNGVIYPTALFSCLSILLDQKSNYEKAASEDGKKLWMSVMQAIYQSMGLLMDAGADLSSRTTPAASSGETTYYTDNIAIGESVLSIAVKNNDRQLFDMLLMHMQNRAGSKPASRAAAIAAWINQQGPDGNSALHLAAMNGNTDMINALLAAGANTSLKNRAGNTAQAEFDARLARDEIARKKQAASEDAAQRQRQQDATDRDATMRGLVAMAGMTAANYQANKAAQAAQAAQASDFYAQSQRAADQQKADVERRNAQLHQQLAPGKAVAGAGNISPAAASNATRPLQIAAATKESGTANNPASGTAAKKANANWTAATGASYAWSQARDYCNGLGKRLPTLQEIRDLFLSGGTEGWVKGDIWTSDQLPGGDGTTHLAYDTNGTGFGDGYENTPNFANSHFHAACVR